MPVAMSVGHVRTNEFTVNIKAPYEIDIEVEKRIPFDTLNCLLGMSSSVSGDCTNAPEVVSATWVVSNDGRVYAQGSSVADRGGVWANGTISREIGRFDGERGRKYQLDVDVLTDGTRLAAGNPRLTVSVDSDFVEGTMFETAFLVYPVVGGLLLIGLILLVVSFVRKRRGQSRITLQNRPRSY